MSALFPKMPAASERPNWLVRWWRRVTKRETYHRYYDPSNGPDYSCWAEVVFDHKTGVTTVLKAGKMKRRNMGSDEI